MMTESLISFHDELEKMASKEVVRGAVIGGGIGAAIGGLAGYASGGEKKKPTKKDRREAALYSAISGGITGAFLGGAMGGVSTGRRDQRPFGGGRGAYGGRSQSDWEREFSEIFRRARERRRQRYGGGRYGGGQRQRRGGAQGSDRSVHFRQRPGPKPDWMGDVKSKDEAKKKWRKVVMKVHPDRARTTKQRNEYEEKAKKINAEWQAWQAGRTYKNLKTKISAVLALRGMDADSFGFLTGRDAHVV